MTLAEKTLLLKQDYDDVYEAGKKAEYDAFWDSTQNYGERTSFIYGYAGQSWTNDTFEPKYDMEVTDAYYMFANSLITNLVESLNKQKVNLSFSKATRLSGTFTYTATRYIGIVDASNSTDNTNLFNGASYLISVEGLILKSDGEQTITNMVRNCPKLEHLPILGGVIAKNGFDVSASKKLDHESLVSYLYALQDKSSVSGSWVCTLGPENLAKLTDAEKAIATQKGWSLA